MTIVPLLALGAALGAGSADMPRPSAVAPITANAKRHCVYSGGLVSRLREFNRLVGRRTSCVHLFHNGAPNWAAWEKPWFIGHGDPNKNWSRWAARGRGRRSVVITIDPFPEEIVGEDWLVRGARGQFNGHARRLARNLVRARMGAATIRLAHEANGSWTPYRLDLRERRGQLRRWGRFWRTMVKAMRSVKGARFRFDWCINAHYRAIPLRYWYPGDDVVDVIGVDAYDSGVRAGVPRWKTIYDQRLGVRDVVRFARRHRKPMSFPEWGVAPAGTPGLLAGGDNAAYVEGIARVVRRERVSYQAYFFTREWRRQLITGPRSLRALRRALR